MLTVRLGRLRRLRRLDMCPITVPDREAEWKQAIDELYVLRGGWNFGALDVQEWIDRKSGAEREDFGDV